MIPDACKIRSVKKSKLGFWIRALKTTVHNSSNLPLLDQQLLVFLVVRLGRYWQAWCVCYSLREQLQILFVFKSIVFWEILFPVVNLHWKLCPTPLKIKSSGAIIKYKVLTNFALLIQKQFSKVVVGDV